MSAVSIERIETLASFIGAHDPAQAFVTCSGTLMARTEQTVNGGPVHWSEWETIEPTMQAVRDWLGY